MENHYHLVTLGCQMNKYDSEKIEGVLVSAGMVSTSDPARAGLILVNTCSVREKAENKVFSLLGRLDKYKKLNSNTVIALGGCMATLRKKDLFKRVPMVDILFGPDSIEKLPALIKNYRKTGSRQSELEFNGGSLWDKPDSNVRPGKITAWVGIMKGCDNHCTYCVVPSARGPEVSRPVDSILAEVEKLARQGYKEVNLLGQNVNSYRTGKKADAVNFPKLLRLVEGVEGIERIRFWTSHPKDLTEELIEVIASSQKVCSAFHLPLQSGSDRVLEMMNRGYTVSDYIGKVEKLRKAVTGITVSTDLLFGFPSETDEDFDNTLKVMEEVRFDSIYFFNYSSRPGTPAAEYPNPVDLGISKSRFRRALELHKRFSKEKSGSIIGKTLKVLCEGPYDETAYGTKQAGPGRLWHGRTSGNHLVIFDSSADQSGKILDLTIDSYLGYNLRGTISTTREK